MLFINQEEIRTMRHSPNQLIRLATMRLLRPGLELALIACSAGPEGPECPPGPKRPPGLPGEAGSPGVEGQPFTLNGESAQPVLASVTQPADDREGTFEQAGPGFYSYATLAMTPGPLRATPFYRPRPINLRLVRFATGQPVNLLSRLFTIRAIPIGFC